MFTVMHGKDSIDFQQAMTLKRAYGGIPQRSHRSSSGLVLACQPDLALGGDSTVCLSHHLQRTLLLCTTVEHFLEGTMHRPCDPPNEYSLWLATALADQKTC